jgi:hypothetical protein
MTWKIVNASTGKATEHSDNACGAVYALLILSAHELKNGRVANYRIEPATEVDPKMVQSLPTWAREELLREPTTLASIVALSAKSA